MPRAQSVLYISDVPPVDHMSGGRVMRRHLNLLAEDGWGVRATVPALPPEELRADRAGFTFLPLPRRRWWWPPSRRSMRLRRWRAILWADALLSSPEIRGDPPDTVLTVLGGPLSAAAVRLARRLRVPLVVIVHDLFSESEPDPRLRAWLERLTSSVLRAADHVFVVSAEMAGALRLLTDAPIEILPPMPEYDAAPSGGWKVGFRSPPVIAHAGLLHSSHAAMLAPLGRALARRGGDLLLVTPPDNPALGRLRAENVAFKLQPPLPDSASALRFLAGEASAIAIGFPFSSATGPVPTGFPSRLVEFSQLGMPVVCIASPENPLQTWARANAWPLRIESNDDRAFDLALAALAEETTWAALSRRMREIASAEFDPKAIHRRLAAGLDPEIVA